MRYVQLTTQQSQQLTQLYKTSQDHRERQRAHALLLSQRSYIVPDLADLFEVDRDTITYWMDRWQDWLTDSQKPCTGELLSPASLNKSVVKVSIFSRGLFRYPEITYQLPVAIFFL